MCRVALTFGGVVFLTACSSNVGVDPTFLAGLDATLSMSAQNQYASPPASDPRLPSAVRVKVAENGDSRALIRNVCAYAAGHQYKLAHVTVYKHTEVNLAAPSSPPTAESDCVSNG